MLSVEHCRRKLGRAAARMSDAEVAEARDQLYVLARVAIRMFLDSRRADGDAGGAEICENPLDRPGERDIME